MDHINKNIKEMQDIIRQNSNFLNKKKIMKTNLHANEGLTILAQKLTNFNGHIDELVSFQQEFNRFSEATIKINKYNNLLTKLLANLTAIAELQAVFDNPPATFNEANRTILLTKMDNLMKTAYENNRLLLRYKDTAVLSDFLDHQFLAAEYLTIEDSLNQIMQRIITPAAVQKDAIDEFTTATVATTVSSPATASDRTVNADFSTSQNNTFLTTITQLKNLKTTITKQKRSFLIMQQELEKKKWTQAPQHRLYCQTLQLYLTFLKENILVTNPALADELNIERIETYLSSYLKYNQETTINDKNINYIISKEPNEEEVQQIKLATVKLPDYQVNVWINFDFDHFRDLIQDYVITTLLNNDETTNYWEFSEVVTTKCRQLWDEFKTQLDTVDHQHSLRENAYRFLVAKEIKTWTELKKDEDILKARVQAKLQTSDIKANVKFLDEETDILTPQINEHLRQTLKTSPNEAFDILKYVVLKKYHGFYHNLDAHLLSTVDVSSLVQNIQKYRWYWQQIPVDYQQYLDQDHDTLNLVNCTNFSNDNITQIADFKAKHSIKQVNIYNHFALQLYLYFEQVIVTKTFEKYQARIANHPFSSLPNSFVSYEQFSNFVNKYVELEKWLTNTLVTKYAIFDNWENMTVDSELYQVTNQYLAILDPTLAKELEFYLLRNRTSGNSEIHSEELADLTARIKTSIARFKANFVHHDVYLQGINHYFRDIKFGITFEVEKLKQSFLAIIAKSPSTLSEPELINHLQNFLANHPSFKNLGTDEMFFDSAKLTELQEQYEAGIKKIQEHGMTPTPIPTATLQEAFARLRTNIIDPIMTPAGLLQQKVCRELAVPTYPFEKLAHNEIYKYNQSDPRFFEKLQAMIKEIYNFLLKITSNPKLGLWFDTIKNYNYQDFIKTYLEVIAESRQPLSGAPFDFQMVPTADQKSYGLLYVKNTNNFLDDIIQEMLKNPDLEATNLTTVLTKKYYDYFKISPGQNQYLDNFLKQILAINNINIEQKTPEVNYADLFEEHSNWPIAGLDPKVKTKYLEKYYLAFQQLIAKSTALLTKIENEEFKKLLILVENNSVFDQTEYNRIWTNFENIIMEFEQQKLQLLKIKARFYDKEAEQAYEKLIKHYHTVKNNFLEVKKIIVPKYEILPEISRDIALIHKFGDDLQAASKKVQEMSINLDSEYVDLRASYAELTTINDSFQTNFTKLFDNIAAKQTRDYFTATEQALIRQNTTDFETFQELLTAKMQILAKRIAVEDLVNACKDLKNSFLPSASDNELSSTASKENLTKIFKRFSQQFKKVANLTPAEYQQPQYLKLLAALKSEYNVLSFRASTTTLLTSNEDDFLLEAAKTWKIDRSYQGELIDFSDEYQKSQYQQLCKRDGEQKIDLTYPLAAKIWWECQLFIRMDLFQDRTHAEIERYPFYQDILKWIKHPKIGQLLSDLVNYQVQIKANQAEITKLHTTGVLRTPLANDIKQENLAKQIENLHKQNRVLKTKVLATWSEYLKVKNSKVNQLLYKRALLALNMVYDLTSDRAQYEILAKNIIKEKTTMWTQQKASKSSTSRPVEESIR
ncbi:hypothetical protein [Spiroplasma eriocheiris]|uniref:Uncharacterized protein n=1 Tax=Spiroplasma eriocheiris TaxID=315358 RepID=A0A0H3XHD1_9MOLU|nr:hypothetical protein [Spiroplasma eriocheiris]AHF57619.1 hypothetical protein SPE_0491 [Spiroplasma eriocheiris CCTCC M 207170]AKM54073.1 hypothetical protein SERIO_v1c04980 [Spiroplasma eriocheiris]